MDRLSPEIENRAVELVANGEKQNDVALMVGFSTKLQYYRYKKKYPDFARAIQEALDSYCDELEDELLTVADRYKDPNKAKVKQQSIMQVLKYRNPTRYGDRIDMNVNQTVNISAALDEAMSRVIDVTPRAQVIALKKADTDD